MIGEFVDEYYKERTMFEQRRGGFLTNNKAGKRKEELQSYRARKDFI